MERQLQPEILDGLPADHPDARHSRRDLRLINAIMGNHRWVARTLLSNATGRRDRVLEIGAGTGELDRRLAAAGIPADGLDLTPQPEDWPNDRQWHRHDLLTFDGYQDYDIVVGNLIFHHLTLAQLAQLGRALKSVRTIIACEPARRRRFQKLFAWIAPLFRPSHVTLHDAHVSIAAGFAGEELPQFLGLDPQVWAWTCRTTLLGGYHFTATRRNR